MSGSSAAAGTDPGHAWTIAAGQLGGQPGYAALIDGYLSTWHRDHPEAGCGVSLSSYVIEHHIGDTGGLAVGGDADDRKRNIERQLGIDQEKAVDASAHEKPLIFISKVIAAEMADS